MHRHKSDSLKTAEKQVEVKFAKLFERNEQH